MCSTGLDLKELGEIDGIDQWNSLVLDEPSYREEVLINIDAIDNLAAIIRNDYKYIVGKNLYNGWSGETGRPDKSNEEGKSPDYKAEDILSSKVGSIFSSMLKQLEANKTLTAEEIYNLRNNATVNCNVKEEEVVRD